MNATIQTIPELLIQTRGNQTEVARMLSCARGTVLKYNRDSKGERHVIVNGVLKGLLDSLIHAGFAEDDEQFDDIRVIRGVKVPGGRLGIKITELENA